MLLTIKEGHGVPADTEAAVRVINTSGAGDGHAVPQGAVTVETVDLQANQSVYALRHLAKRARFEENLPGRWRQQPRERGQQVRAS